MGSFFKCDKLPLLADEQFTEQYVWRKVLLGEGHDPTETVD